MPACRSPHRSALRRSALSLTRDIPASDMRLRLWSQPHSYILHAAWCGRGLILPVLLLSVLACSACALCGCRRVPQNSSVETQPPAATPAPPFPVEFKLVDITDQLGIDIVYQNGREAGHAAILESLGGGVAVVDVDADGWLDLFVPTGGGFEAKRIFGLPSRLLRNLGRWHFADVSQPAGGGFPATHYTHGAVAGDYDNDGFQDILVTGYGGLQLWHNLGDGTFEEIAFKQVFTTRCGVVQQHGETSTVMDSSTCTSPTMWTGRLATTRVVLAHAPTWLTSARLRFFRHYRTLCGAIKSMELLKTIPSAGGCAKMARDSA